MNHYELDGVICTQSEFLTGSAKLLRIDVQDASSGHGGRRGMFQVADLKQ